MIVVTAHQMGKSAALRQRIWNLLVKDSSAVVDVVSTEGAVRLMNEPTTCRSCGAPIYWEKTKNGKPMPISVATGETHFADCPQSKKWSGKSAQKDVQPVAPPAEDGEASNG